MINKLCFIDSVIRNNNYSCEVSSDYRGEQNTFFKIWCFTYVYVTFFIDLLRSL